MRRKEQATPEPLPVDGARIRQLIAQAAADRDAGVVMHHHPALEELGELCGILTYYRFQLEDPRTPAALEDFARQAIENAEPEGGPVMRRKAKEA